jgi:hypothetical protein
LLLVAMVAAGDDGEEWGCVCESVSDLIDICPHFGFVISIPLRQWGLMFCEEKCCTVELFSYLATMEKIQSPFHI